VCTSASSASAPGNASSDSAPSAAAAAVRIKLKDPDLLRTQCLIGGRWVGAEYGTTLAVTNPATGEVLARVPMMGQGARQMLLTTS
jgi:hypothetical protein